MITYSIAHPPNLLDALLNTNNSLWQIDPTCTFSWYFRLSNHVFQCSLKPPLLISITSSILPVNEPLLWCYSPVRMLIVHHQEDLTSVLVVGGFIGAGVGHSWHAGRPGGRAWGTRGGALLEVQNVDIFIAVFQFPLEVPGTKPSS